MELRVLYIRTVLTSCKSLSALSSGRNSTARLTDLHRSQSTLTYILSERSLVHLTCGDATRLRLLSHMLSLLLFVRHHTWRFQAGNDVQKRRKSAWACWVPRSCSHRSTDRTHTVWIVTNRRVVFIDISQRDHQKKKDRTCLLGRWNVAARRRWRADETNRKVGYKFQIEISVSDRSRSFEPPLLLNRRLAVWFRVRNSKHTGTRGRCECQTVPFPTNDGTRGRNFRVQRWFTHWRHLKSSRRTNWHWQPRSTRARTHSTFPHSSHPPSYYTYIYL